MSTNHSKIQWTERTWNPVRGCSRCSPGCLNCYAEKIAARFSDEGQPFHLYAERTPQPHWTGKVELVESALLEPLSWRKPSMVFVNSMSDLFHEGLKIHDIDHVFAVMSQSPQHTFQILTKRAERMYEYMVAERTPEGIDEAATHFGWCHANVQGRWPLPNVWLGVSVENQQYADERIPWLLKTPASVRFVSYEPALGPVNFLDIGGGLCALTGWRWSRDVCEIPAELRGIDWVIVGGESGPGARPFDIAWARSVVEQCRAADVACFVKQLGANCVDQLGKMNGAMFDRKGGNFDLFPADIRVREYPANVRASGKNGMQGQETEGVVPLHCGTSRSEGSR